MNEDGAMMLLQTTHDDLRERLTLLADNPALNDGQRELARSWRKQIDRIQQHTAAPLSVAFLAAVGRGKSSLIAAATGLRLDEPDPKNPKRWSVLPVGDGRTTLGEIRVQFNDRSDILLHVEPMTRQDLEMEVRIFAQDQYAASRKKMGATGGDREPGAELSVLLQAWLMPAKASDQAGDSLRQEALAAADEKSLETQWLARIDFEQRCRPLEQTFNNDQSGLVSLKETLAALMDGTLPCAPVPMSTRIDRPRTDVGKEIATIIDTQGIDDAPDAWVNGRTDILDLILDPDTLLVVCSAYEDAPDPISLSLLKTLQEMAGTQATRVRLVLVDKRTKDGDAKEQRDETRRLRQCRDKLRREGIDIPDGAVVAIDIRQDATGVQKMLLEFAAGEQKFRVDSWKQALANAEAATSTLQDQTFAARAGEFDLRLWWAWDAEIVRNRRKLTDGLTALGQDLQNVHFHWSQLYATVRRRGRYPKLDLAIFGAVFATRPAIFRFVSALEKVKAEASNLSASTDNGIDEYLKMRVDNFTAAVREYGRAMNTRWRQRLAEYFVSPRSNDMWQWCTDRWGDGKGYVAAVANRIAQEAPKANLRIKFTDSVDQYLPQRPELFKLRKVRLKNFRGIEDRTIEVGNTTVFIGDNGLGKTCWLEAIAAVVGTFLPGVGAGAPPVLVDGDVREVVRTLGGLPDRQRQLPMQIDVDAVIEGHPLTWSRKIDQLPMTEATIADDALQIKARRAGEEIRAHSMRQLPVLAYYGTQRLWPASIEATNDVGNNRIDGYRDCLKAASTHEHMLSWMRKFTFAELQNKKPVVQLRAIQRAVLTCVEGAKEFLYQVDLGELVLVMENGQRPTFRMLSDGYRNMVAMVADIAWRASVLNPQLRDRAPELAEGVVLIDEIDLHLHPNWQRRVLGSLRRAFPRLQFITTTHSPFIVQSLEPGQLVNLDENAEGGAYANESPEDIAERHMGVDVPQRSDRRKREYDVATRYYDLLERVPAADAVELANLKAELDELLAPYAENQALVAFLDRQRQMAEAKRS